MRIVIADRNVSFLRPFRSHLWSRGHDVELASDVFECLFLIRDSVPDVLVIGIELDGLDSEEVLTTMEHDVGLRNIPVLLLVSSSSDTELRRHLMVVSSARPTSRFDDLARQLSFLNILNDAGIRMKVKRPMRFATSSIVRLENKIGTA